METREFPYVLNNRWEVTSKLGQGGMGTVYMARDRNISTLGQDKKACVVKELRDDYFREEDKEKAQEFFRREQRVLASLDHPNIVRVLDTFDERGRYYLVMEYVEGHNLHDMLMKVGEPFPEKSVIHWAIQICDVLHYLHNHSPPVIYRDLKPSNVMIDTKDHVKLIDFGIARPFEDAEDNTHVASQGYSPPEQYWGQADRRSDIYALGATIYFLLTGQDPPAFNVASPRKINPEVSEHLDEIVKIATQQEPRARFQSADEMKELLLSTPADIQPKTWSGLKITAITVGLIGAFFGLLVWGANVHEAMQQASEKVATYEQQTKETKRKERVLLEKMEKLQKAQSMYMHEQLDSGDNKSAVLTPKPAPPAGIESKVPLFMETHEPALTDPDGLGI